MATTEDHELIASEVPSQAWEKQAAPARGPCWKPLGVTSILGLLTLGAVLGLMVCGVASLIHRHSKQQVLREDIRSRPAFLSEVALEYTPQAEEEVSDGASGNVDGLKHAKQLIEEAQSLKALDDKLKAEAAKFGSQSEGLAKEAANIKQQAITDAKDADAARQRAQDLRSQAEALKKEATDSIGKAADLDKEASRRKVKAEQKKQEAEVLSQKAKTTSDGAERKEKEAVNMELKALDETAAQRVCIHLPGVKLQGVGPATFDTILGPHDIADEWQCSDWCLRHTACRQAVFTWETSVCELYGEATTQPIVFRERWPFFNTTYCGAMGEKDNMLQMLHQVYDQKPWVPPPHNCSWGGDNCIHTKCCADVCKATWDFKTCEAFTCYKKDEHFAGCKIAGADPGWDGENLGGHPNGEIEPAPEGKLVQGVRLYCFSVVMWNDPPKQAWMSSEGEIAGHWKEQGKGIVQCDDYNIFDGIGGGSVHNILSFVQAWKKVQDDGRWKNSDWTIKVDPDAVFFPEHFRQKIMWNLRTPQGSAVFLRNTFYKFQLLGALEALSREAMEIYFERSWECEAHLGQQGGEDYWLLQCLEGLGINYQTDVTLLHDKYAADENCKDPYGVAHHFFKKTKDWDECWDKAEKAWNGAHAQ